MTLIRQVRQNASDVWPPSDLFWGSTLFKWKYWTQHYSRMDCEPWAPAFWCLYMVHVFDYVPIKEVYLTTSFWAQLNSGPLRDPPPLPWSNTLLRQSIPDFFSQFDLDAKDWHLQRLCVAPAYARCLWLPIVTEASAQLALCQIQCQPCMGQRPGGSPKGASIMAWHSAGIGEGSLHLFMETAATFDCGTQFPATPREMTFIGFSAEMFLSLFDFLFLFTFIVFISFLQLVSPLVGGFVYCSTPFLFFLLLPLLSLLVFPL